MISRTTITYWIGALAVLGSIALLSAQRRTIPDLVASGGGWAPPSIPSGGPPSLRQVALLADTVVRGTVGPAAPSYLSPEQDEIYTDFEIRNPIVLYERETPSTSQPGAPRSILVTVRGGTMNFSGTPFSQQYPGQPVMTQGRERLFLLRKTDSKYRIASDYFGVFEIVGNKLVQLSPKQGFAHELDSLSVDASIREIVAALRGPH
jgi:hypothetical protein